MKIYLDKETQIVIDVETEGINKTQLNYYLRIPYGEYLEYGIKGSISESGGITFMIPPLNSISPSFLVGSKQIRIDVDDGQKFYMKPFEGQVEIIKEPSVTTISVDDVEKNPIVNISFQQEEDSLNKLDIKVFDIEEIEEEIIIEQEENEKNLIREWLNGN